jgi:hypothetical protein
MPKNEVSGCTSTVRDSGTGGVGTGASGAGAAAAAGAGAVAWAGGAVSDWSSGVKFCFGAGCSKGIPSAKAAALTEQNNKSEALATKEENFMVTLANSL